MCMCMCMCAYIYIYIYEDRLSEGQMRGRRAVVLLTGSARAEWSVFMISNREISN